MSPEPKPVLKRDRDIRLDFFRGVAMIIILFAHITDNPWTLWLPGRFGFSDSTEIFVFCSGIASALAYGAVFHKSWLTGAGRILRRIWTVYWVHIGIFLVTLMMVLLFNRSGLFIRDEVGALNLYPFVRHTSSNLPGLLTLTYVPNYFDILPMYIVLLALVPLMLALGRVSPLLAITLSLVLWVIGTNGVISIPAEAWFPSGSSRQWFFNPLAWQLVFFTGFALALGWLPVPPISRSLICIAMAVVIFTVPFAWFRVIDASQLIKLIRADWAILFDKTGFGLLRYVHFLSLAYLAFAAAGPGGINLRRFAALWPRLSLPVIEIGRQSLAVFAVSMVLARGLGALLHLWGPSLIVTAILNLAGLFLIWLTARVAGWVKGQGWGIAPIPMPAPETDETQVTGAAMTGFARLQEVKA